MTPADPLDAGVEIGHARLKVSDLDRVVAFYRDVLGFTTTGRLGDQAALPAANGDQALVNLPLDIDALLDPDALFCRNPSSRKATRHAVRHDE